MTRWVIQFRAWCMWLTIASVLAIAIPSAAQDAAGPDALGAIAQADLDGLFAAPDTSLSDSAARNSEETAPSGTFDPENPDAFIACADGEAACRERFGTMTRVPDTADADVIDTLLGSPDFDGPGALSEAGLSLPDVALCEPGSDPVTGTTTTRTEYRCERGVAVEQSRYTCDLHLVHEVSEGYTYECTLTREADGSLTASSECEILEDSETCERTGSRCDQTGGAAYTVSECREGPEAIQRTAACQVYRAHELELTWLYECAYVRDPDTGGMVPDADCAALIAAGCAQTGQSCAEDRAPDTETVTCETGATAALSPETCEERLQVVARERPVYTAARDWNADTGTHDPDVVAQAVNSADCTLGEERCTEPVPPVTETLHCETGFRETERRETCELPLSHTLDTDYLYDGRETWDTDADRFVESSGFWRLEDSCSAGSRRCTRASEPAFESYTCETGYRGTYSDEACEDRLEVTVDEDFVYTASRTWNVSEERFEPDALMEAVTGAACTPGEERCTRASPGVYKTATCERGRRIDRETATLSETRRVETDDDYIHVGRETWDLESESFVPDAAHDTLSATTTCQLLERSCAKAGPGRYQTYTCRKGFRDSFQKHRCDVARVVTTESDFVYQAVEEWDRDSASYRPSQELERLRASEGCAAQETVCSRRDPPPTETRSCEIGTRTTFTDREVVVPRVVEVDADYIYAALRDWTGTTHAPSAAHAALSRDASCARIDTTCSVPTPTTYDSYACQLGYRDAVTAETCERRRVVTVDTDYRYTVDRNWDADRDRWTGLSDWDAVRATGAQCVRESERCTVPSPGVTEPLTCEEGYRIEARHRTCTAERGFTVDRDYRYTGFETWDGFRYRPDPTLTAMRNTSQLCRRESRTGEQPHSDLVSTYACQTGTLTYGSTETCEATLDVAVTSTTHWLYSASTGSEAADHMSGLTACTHTTRGGRQQSRCTSPQSYEGILLSSDASVLGYGYKFDAEDFVIEQQFASDAGCTFQRTTYESVRRPGSGRGMTRGDYEIMTLQNWLCEGPKSGRGIMATTRQTIPRFDHSANANSAGARWLQRQSGCTYNRASGGMVLYRCDARHTLESLRSDGTDVTHATTDSWNLSACPSAAPTADRCIEGPGTRTIGGASVRRDCWKRELTHGTTETQSGGTCRPPQGYVEAGTRSSNPSIGEARNLQITTYEKSHALADAEHVRQAVLCHEGWWRRADGSTVSVDSCNGQASGATLVHSECMYEEAGKCRLAVKSYQRAAGGPSEGYGRFREVWRCEKAPIGGGLSQPEILRERKAWTEDDSACRAMVAGHNAGCSVVSDRLAGPSTSKTVDGLTLRGQWQREYTYDCRTRIDVNTCGAVTAGLEAAPIRYASLGTELDLEAGHPVGTVWRPISGSARANALDRGEKLRTHGLPMPAPDGIIRQAATGETTYTGRECLHRVDGVCTLWRKRYEREIEDPSGGCHEETEIWRCEDVVQGAGTAEPIREVVSETWDESTCTAMVAGFNQGCTKTASTPGQGGTRTVDGLAVSRPHWATTESYECTQRTDIDDCRVPAGYERTGETCLWREGGSASPSVACALEERHFRKARPDPTGGCTTHTDTFRCEDRSHGAPLRLEHDILDEYWDLDAYRAVAAEGCQYASHVNADPTIRTVDGLALTRSWERRYTLACASQQEVNSCGARGEVQSLIEQGTNQLTVRPYGHVPPGRYLASRQPRVVLSPSSIRIAEGTSWLGPAATSPYRAGQTVRIRTRHALSRDTDDTFIARHAVFGLTADERSYRMVYRDHPMSASAVDAESVLTVPAGWAALGIIRVRPGILLGYSATTTRPDGVEAVATVVDISLSDADGHMPDLVRRDCVEPDGMGGCAVHRYDMEIEVDDPSGGCGQRTQSFRCDREIAGAGPVVGRPATVAGMHWDETACAPRIDDPLCTWLEAESQCVDGPETRLVDGVPVHQDCWTFARVYECAERDTIDSCAPPEAASLHETDCLWSDRAGTCRLFEQTWRLPDHDPSGGCDIQESRFRCEDAVEVDGHPLDPIETITHVVATPWDPAPLEALRADWDSCTPAPGVCTSGAATRRVNGIEVTLDCWAQSREVSCRRETALAGCPDIAETDLLDTQCLSREGDGGPANACVGERVDYRVAQPDPSGGCHVFTHDFTCEDRLSGAFEESAVTRHVESTRWDRSECAAQLEAFAACETTGTVCSEGRETRDVNGLAVTRNCWAYRTDRTCETRDPIDTCNLQPGFAKHGEPICMWTDARGICRLFEQGYRREAEDPSGGCWEWTTPFRCEDPVSEAGAPTDTVLEIESRHWDDAACAALDTTGPSTACAFEDVCLEGPETRTVEGLDVSESCWRRGRTYDCTDREDIDTCEGRPDTATQAGRACAARDASGTCTLWSEEWTWETDDGSGGCHRYERTATCEAPLPGHAPADWHYEIVGTPTDSAACEALRAGFDVCQLERRACTGERGELRPSELIGVNGEPFVPMAPGRVPTIERDCWTWELAGDCAMLTPVDTCEGRTDSCERTASRCAAYALDGACLRVRHDYRCAVEGSGGCVRETRAFACEAKAGSETSDASLRPNGAGPGLHRGSPYIQLASADDTLSLEILKLVANASAEAQAGSLPEPVDVIAEVVRGYWDARECGVLQGQPACREVSRVCSEEGTGSPEPVRRAQDDLHTAHAGAAGLVNESCWEETVVYDCSVTSDLLECAPADSCTEESSQCRLEDENGTCLLREVSYSCEAAQCEPSRRVCDGRRGDARQSGHKYVCETYVVTHGEQTQQSTSTCGGLVGCHPVQLRQDIEHFLVDSVEPAGGLRPEGRRIEDLGTAQRTTYAFYCAQERSGATAASYRGEIAGEGLDADVSDCAALDADDQCRVLSEQCVTGLTTRVSERGQHTHAEVCQGARRVTYDCDEGEASGAEGAACSGACESYTETYECEAEVDGAGNSVANDNAVVARIDGAACAPYADDETCALQDEVCTDGPATRPVGSGSLSAACWRWERAYICETETGRFDNCEPDASCTYQSSICLGESDTGTCLTEERVYQCTTVEEEILEEGTPADCEAVTDETGDSGPGEADETRSLPDALAALQSMGRGAEDYREAPEMFAGDALKCSKLLLGTKNCCKRSGLLIGLGCSEDARRLREAREADRCLSLGSYCSKKALFGACLKKKETDCCYASSLARIVIETARAQNGHDLGTPKRPTCAGLTVTQFQLLDLANADFSTVADDILADMSAESPGDTAERLRRSIEAMQANRDSGLPGQPSSPHTLPGD